ncbi:hypothetical protein [Pseudogracilibacillus sp. SO30301A]|uniref:hypothetical protein n=1 Tax=Pseudogracilibacillus sp. SO30301A TaxID=3098291 RepID=UPI00300DD25C
MKAIIKEYLRLKDIGVSEEILEEINIRWKNYHTMKKKLNKLPDGTKEIALRNIPEGDRK